MDLVKYGNWHYAEYTNAKGIQARIQPETWIIMIMNTILFKNSFWYFLGIKYLCFALMVMFSLYISFVRTYQYLKSIHSIHLKLWKSCLHGIIIYFFSFVQKYSSYIAVNGKFKKYNCIHTDRYTYEYFYAFVEFKGGQYQDGLMATCPVEEKRMKCCLYR